MEGHESGTDINSSCSCRTYAVGAVVVLLTIVAFKIYRMVTQKQKHVTKPGVVLLHIMIRGSKSPNISPFALKLETYLRLAKIPYEVDTKDVRGPKGKFPWITLDGEELGDSTFVMNFLNQRFNVNLNKNLDDVTKANHWALQIMLEDHMFWILIVHRMSLPSVGKLREIIAIPFYMAALYYVGRKFIIRRAYAQGMGLHSKAEQLQLLRKDLQTLSTILGKNPFFGGQSPAEIDCTVFGFTTQWIINAPGSEYEALINEEEFKNVVEHCHRMKELVWPDWDNFLRK